MEWSRRQKDRLADYFQKLALLLFAGTLADREISSARVMLGAIASGLLVAVSMIVDGTEEGD